MFKKLLASLGVGGGSVETELADPNVLPGGQLTGQVHLTAGDVAQDVEALWVGLTARVEVENSDDSESNRQVVFHRAQLGGRHQLVPGQRFTVPFTLDVPWETPVSAVFGQRLNGMAIGVHTELEIAGALDATDLDPITVHALEGQQAVLDALAKLDFRFRRADLEQGALRGLPQRLPFYQEIEFGPGARSYGVNEIEVTFVATGTETHVLLEADKRGGFLSAGGDSYRVFTVPHAGVASTDWAGHLDQLLSGLRR